jgi:hypothetical protein
MHQPKFEIESHGTTAQTLQIMNQALWVLQRYTSRKPE